MKHLYLIIFSALLSISATAQTIGDAFYIYRNDGEFNAFFREEIDSMAYSCYDLDGTLYDDYVTQLVYTPDSIYRIPLEAIDSVAFDVNKIVVSDDYIALDEENYVVEKADTLHGEYILRFLNDGPSLKEGNIISIVNDTLVEMVRISKVTYPDKNHACIQSNRASLGEVFMGGSFTLSTETTSPTLAPTRVFTPVEVIIYDTENKTHRLRRADTNFTKRLYTKTLDYSGYDIHKTDYTRLYLEKCTFDFNLDLIISCNFSSKGEAIGKYMMGDLALMKAAVKGNVSTDFMLRFDASAEKKGKFDEILLKKNIHKPVKAKFVVAGVPIWVVMNTHLFADGEWEAKGSFSAYSGFATSTTAELGFSWSQSKNIRPHAAFDTSFSLHKPTMEGRTHLEYKVSVFPRINFSLFGVSGPSFDIKPYLRPVIDAGFYDQMGSNKQDFYGAECDAYGGYDAAVGVNFLPVVEKKLVTKSKPWNVIDKMMIESPKEIKFQEASSEYLTVDEPIQVTFYVTEHDYVFDESHHVTLPFTVKFETNSGTLSNDFALVDPSTGLVTMEWTPSRETTDGKDAYILATMHDADGHAKTADRWTPSKKEIESYCPDSNHPHAIDLGLPSGTKWACCNVGASKPEEYGGYYAWGETKTKSYYDGETYQYYNSNTGLVNIGSDIAGTSYDAATSNWGAPWRMPTSAQIQELLNNTTSQWTTQNGVYGRKFTGRNGGTVFLPAAGNRWDVYPSLDVEGSLGEYWSSSFNESLGSAYGLGFDSGSAYWSNNFRISGFSVRPVRKN